LHPPAVAVIGTRRAKQLEHVAPQGKLSAARVTLDAVKQGVYTPTLLNGVPVPVIMAVTVNFKLS
jgi:hypothetical protein